MDQVKALVRGPVSGRVVSRRTHPMAAQNLLDLDMSPQGQGTAVNSPRALERTVGNEPVTLGHAIERWLQHPNNLELAESTMKGKRRVLNHLVKTVGGAEFLVDCLEYGHFADCIVDLGRGGSEAENQQRRRRGMGPRLGRSTQSLQYDTSVLTMFAEFLRYMGWHQPTFYPLKRFTGTSKAIGSKAKAVKPGVPVGDYARLLDLADRHHPRTRVVIAIGIFYGRRISEILKIKWKDVNLIDQTMTYENVKRGITIADKAFPLALKLELERWWLWYEGQCGQIDPEWYLVPGKMLPGTFWRKDRDLHSRAQKDTRVWPIVPGRPATPGKIDKDVQRALLALGWASVKGEGVHTLRRTAARQAEADHGLGVTQELLDHASRRTTEIYTDNADGRRQYNKIMKGETEPTPDEPAESAQERSNVVSMDDYRRRAV